MKRLIIIAIALFAVGGAMAQENISKQMEVTRAYTPRVGQAAKLPVAPRMVDTVRLRPDVRYSITPTAWQTVFETPKYAPARLAVAPYQKNRPFYLRAGMGYPLQSTADLYFNPYMGDHSTFGMWLNHRGSYSRIENDMGLKPRSTEMLNEVGLYGTKNFGRRQLEGSLSYDNRIYNAYGVCAPLNLLSGDRFFSKGNTLQFGHIGGHLSFGDTFTDLSRLNFAAGLDLGAAHNGSFYQLDIDGWFKIGKMFGRHGFEVNVSEQSAILLWSGWHSMVIRLSPDYLLSPGKFSLRAGVDFSYIDSYNERYLMPSPRLLAKYELAEGAFIPFVSLSSELLDNSPQALSRQNPYSDDDAPMGWTRDGRFGFSGNLGDIFTYRLWGGVSQFFNRTFFVGYQTGTHIEEGENNSYTFDPLRFDVVTDNGLLYTVGTELGLNNLGGFSATLHGNWFGYRLDGLDFAPGMPSWDAGVHLAYKHRRFALRAGVDVIGNRKFLDYNTLSKYNASPFNSVAPAEVASKQVTSIGAKVDVSLGAEYNISDDFGVFVEGSNLANQRLYPIAHYAGLGANLMLGIKATF